MVAPQRRTATSTVSPCRGGWAASTEVGLVSVSVFGRAAQNCVSAAHTMITCGLPANIHRSGPD